MDTISDGNGRNWQGARRMRQPVRRECNVGFKLTRQEFDVLADAAQRTGRAMGAYAAEAALAAARGESAGMRMQLPELLQELMRAAGLVRRIGINLNQAVARLNATGQHSADLVPYAAESFRRAEHLDAVAEEIRKSLGKTQNAFL